MDLQPLCVQRYRRTDQARLGEWAPVGASWKSEASAGLVAHDVYHHLPEDVGTFVQEVASLGAEWYIDIQGVGVKPVDRLYAWPISGFERNVMDTVLNALESREKQAFALPERQAQALSAPEMDFFAGLAKKACEAIASHAEPSGLDPLTFEQRFTQLLVWGYREAQRRFPLQTRVREGSRRLVSDLANLAQSEVPFGHEITISLQGYECVISFTDADAEFLREQEVVPAVMMTWCSCEPGYPATHVTLHRNAADYAEHVAAHFDAQEAQGLPEVQCHIPQGEQYDLSPVYIRDMGVQAHLLEKAAVTLPVSLMHLSDYTPRGIRVI